MKLSKYIFRSRLAFSPVDPLGDGLREMIRREQSEPGAISLYHEEYSPNWWADVSRDLHGDRAVARD